MVTEQTVWNALSTVMDPEIPFSVVDLGLVYGVFVGPDDDVRVQMTLTTRGCPLVRRIAEDVEKTVRDQSSASQVTVELVWDPPWSPEMATDRVRAHLRER